MHAGTAFDELIEALQKVVKGDDRQIEEAKRLLGSTDFQMAIRDRYRQINDPDERKRIKIALNGCGASEFRRALPRCLGEAAVTDPARP